MPHRLDLREHDGGTSIRDTVRYALPAWPLGELGNVLVRRQLQAIFRFRQQAIRELLKLRTNKVAFDNVAPTFALTAKSAMVLD